MIEIASKRNYLGNIALISIIIIGALLILFLFKPLQGIPILLIFISIIVVFLSESFTLKVGIDDHNVKITYYKFFVHQQKNIKRSIVSSRVIKKATFRSPAHLILEIRDKQKLVHQIDSRNGFTDEDLLRIDYILNQPLVTQG